MPDIDLAAYLSEKQYKTFTLARFQTLVMTSFDEFSAPVARPTEEEEPLATALLQAMLYCPEMPLLCLNYHLLTEAQLVEVWLAQGGNGFHQPSLSKLRWTEMYSVDG